MTWISVLLLFHHFCLLYPNQKGFTALLDAQVFQVARMPVKWSNLFRTWTLVGHQNLLSMPFCPFEKCWTKTLFCSTKLIYIYIHAPHNSYCMFESTLWTHAILQVRSLPFTAVSDVASPDAAGALLLLLLLLLDFDNLGPDIWPDLLGFEVMLVYQMNGEDLKPAHGFPLRLIVPGWYGMASASWWGWKGAWGMRDEGSRMMRRMRRRTIICNDKWEW